MIFNKKNTKKKNAIIVGCGRFGSRIAGDLSLEDWDVTVIDNDRNAFRLLPSFFGGSTILSYATDLEKVQLDVDKFINILSNYDYESAYSLLSEEYKINNFETLSKYIKFLEKNFYNNRIYSIENIERDLQDYIVTVKVKENDRTASEEKINKIAISLGEKADFTMAVIVE